MNFSSTLKRKEQFAVSDFFLNMSKKWLIQFCSKLAKTSYVVHVKSMCAFAFYFLISCKYHFLSINLWQRAEKSTISDFSKQREFYPKLYI